MVIIGSNYPFRYFGNRGSDVESFFDSLLKEKNFSTIYEPFCGSAIFSLRMMQASLGKHYVISDIYKPITSTLLTLKHKPEEIVTTYGSHVKRLNSFISYEEKVSYFKSVQSQLNDSYQSDCQFDFIFVNNYSKLNIPIINKSDHVSDFNDDYLKIVENEDLFKKQITAISRLIGKNSVEVRHANFKDVLCDASAGDLVYLDPPYPDLPEGESSIYQRLATRDELHELIIKQLEKLHANHVSCILFYGTYEIDERYIFDADSLGLHHFVRLGRIANSLFDEYLEHCYISKNLISDIDKCFDGIPVVPYKDVKNKSRSDVVAMIKLKSIIGVTDKSRLDGLSVVVNGRSVGVTKRESDVLQCLAKGCSAKETAKALVISPRTVEIYIDRLKKKFGSRSKIELISKIKFGI
jgi:site-specific DNA-adenine methylase/DNA-binding CsgD family transcriptional regulator